MNSMQTGSSQNSSAEPISPYGGSLVSLLQREERVYWLNRANSIPSLQISESALNDLEMLAVGAYSPVNRFMGKADCQRVLAEMRLLDGTLFPVPILLTVPKQASVIEGAEVVLRTATNEIAALMRIEEIYEHSHSLQPVSDKACNISGSIKVLNLPGHFDFTDLRQTPAAVRRWLVENGHQRVVAYPTDELFHRFNEWTVQQTIKKLDAAALIQPQWNAERAGWIDFYTFIRTYKTLGSRYLDPARGLINLLPQPHPVQGVRAILLQAIIQRNYGASDLLLPVRELEHNNLTELLQREVGINAIPAYEAVYLPNEARYEALHRNESSPSDSSAEDRKVYYPLSQNAQEAYLEKGQPLPDWFARSELSAVLTEAYVPKSKRGFCVWFTGLPSAGKSTVANILTVMLRERGRNVTVLDGDVVRTNLSKGLGFSKEDRETNVLRVGFVAAQVVKHNGAVICALVSPYEATRNQVRAMVSEDQFILVHVDTPVGICENRDVKGMYQKARRGEIRDFTGVDDPYQPPVNPELVLTTQDHTAEENARQVLRHLEDRGFLSH